MTQSAETFIYARSGGPITLQVSEDNVTFYDLTLSSTSTLTEALAEWQAQANAHGSLSANYNFAALTSGLIRFTSSLTAYYKGPSDLWRLLGFGSESMGSGFLVDSTAQVLGRFVGAVGYTLSEERGERKAVSLRRGRSMVVSHSHAQVVTVSMTMEATEFEALKAGPLFNGKLRVHHSTGSVAYSPSDTTGYLDVYPTGGFKWRPSAVTDTWGQVTITGTLSEGADWTDTNGLEGIARGWSYGWGVLYAAKVEGQPYVFVEEDLGASAPTDYTVLAGLVIDGSAAIGATVDRRAGLGAGYDLTLSFLDVGSTRDGEGPTRQSTADAKAMRALFRSPTNAGRLTADLAHGDTASMTVEGTGFAATGSVHLGREAIQYASRVESSGVTTFSTLTRGFPDWRAYDHNTDSAVAAYVTDSVQVWRGREVELYAVPISPFGSVPGANLLSEAVLVWRGHVAQDPKRKGGLWQLPCKPYDRVLTKPLGAGVSGKAVWVLDDDETVTIEDPSAVFHLVVGSTNPTVSPWTSVDTSGSSLSTIKPFIGYTAGDVVKAATWRQVFKDAANSPTLLSQFQTELNASPTPATLDGFTWVKSYSGGQLTYVFAAQMTPGAVGQGGHCAVNLWTGTVPPQVRVYPDQDAIPAYYYPQGQGFWQMESTTGDYNIQGSLLWKSAVGLYTLRVVVEDGNTSAIPATGSLIVEGDDQTSVFEYTKRTITGSLVDFELAPGQQPNLAPFAEALMSGDVAEVSVRIGFRDSGTVPDVLRRMLAASGRGTNDGTYDVGQLAQGYDLEHVDHAGVGTGLSGPVWDILAMDLVIDLETSYSSAFGELLALGNRGLVTRLVDDDVKLTCIDTGLTDTGYYVSTVTDATLTMHQGSSVRVLDDAYPRPNSVKLTVEAKPDTDEVSVVANDTQAQRAHGIEQWTATTAGLTLSQATFALQAWSQTLLGLGLVRPQVAEVVVHPGIVAQPGDLVRLELTHPDLWTYSTGQPGYTGPARVLGARINLATGTKLLTLMLEGAHRALSLSPSEAITAIGAGSPPAYVEVRQEAYPLLAQWLERDGAFKLAAYLPSSDRDDQRWTISAVTDTGTACRLTISAQDGTFTATTDWYVANVDTAQGTDAQDDHAHTDSEGYWL